MSKLTKEQYEILKKYERHLRRGYYGDYTYGLYQNDFDELLKIYKSLGGCERLKYSCNVCVLRLTKFLGKLYFEWTPDENPISEKVVEAVLEEPIEEVKMPEVDFVEPETSPVPTEEILEEKPKRKKRVKKTKKEND